MSIEPFDLEQEVQMKMNTMITEFIEVYIRYSRRWRTLVLGSPVNADQHWASFERLGAEDLPQLQNVHTSAGSMVFGRPDYEQGSRSLTPVGKLLTRTTSLQRLDVTREWISVRMLDLPLEWSRLTELRIASPVWRPSEPGRFDLGVFWQALAEQCSSLVIFSFTNFMSYELVQPLDAVSLTPVPWPTIQEFILSARGSSHENFMDNVRDAFERISLPSVERLSIGLYCDELIRDPTAGDSDIPAAPWERLLLRSQPPIKHLELDFPRSQWGIRALLQSLKPLGALKSLRIGHERAWDMGYEELVRGLGEPFEGGLLCPGLEELELEECATSDIEVMLMLADCHTLMSHPSLKLIRANFALGIEYDGSEWSSMQGKGGFDVSETQREVTLTRKLDGGATMILTLGRPQVDINFHDRPASGVPGIGYWY
ncbi:hypothetical protein AAF712_011123 [Marasmius tenuissimus]|uniref:Uncharacterized protein n=1 Tax=Marasmius tenuissimus TaxID=585030 RepID=A0ABR2ZLD1_9AGAR